MEYVKRLKYEPDPTKFDLRTHEWDSQGKLVGKNLYRKFIVGGTSYYERPVNSGNLWFENNQPAGRVECTFGPTGKISAKTFALDAPHKEYTVPLSGADKTHFELEQARERNANLELELAAIRKELSAKAATPTPSVEAPQAEPTTAAPKLTKRGS